MKPTLLLLLLSVCASGQQMVKTSSLDPQQPATSPPNRVRDVTPTSNAPLGTLAIRRTFTNTSKCSAISLMFKVSDWTRGTQPGEADLELLYAEPFDVQLSNGSTVTVYTVREDISGWLGTGLMQVAPGAQAHVQFLFAITKGGSYRFNVSPFVEVEMTQGTVGGKPAYLMPHC